MVAVVVVVIIIIINIKMIIIIIIKKSNCFEGREARENMFKEVSGLIHYLDQGMLPISVL